MQVYFFATIASLSVLILLVRFYNRKIQMHNDKLVNDLEYMSKECSNLSLKNSELQKLYNLEVEAKFLSLQRYCKLEVVLKPHHRKNGTR